MLRSLALLSTGIAIGVAASFAWLHALRNKVKLYEAYFHKGVDRGFEEAITNVTLKPELIVRGCRKREHLAYHCSSCDLEFPLPDNLPPKEAMIGLYRRFKEHIEHEHPEASGHTHASGPEA